MRAAAGLDPRGVVRDVVDAVERHAKPFGDELRKARLMALARRHRADHELDPPSGSTVISVRSRGAPRGDLDVIGDADAAQLASRRGPRMAGRKPGSRTALV